MKAVRVLLQFGGWASMRHRTRPKILEGRSAPNPGARSKMGRRWKGQQLLISPQLRAGVGVPPETLESLVFPKDWPETNVKR